MDEREPRQGYSDMNERQREGVPALEQPAEPAGGAGREQGDSAGPGGVAAVRGPETPAGSGTSGGFDATSASGAATDQSTASMMGDPSAVEAGANAEADDRPSRTARIDPTDLAPSVDEGGAESGGQRSGGDGGMSSVTGG